MANENVKKFEELLRADEGLQAKLREAAEAFDGDRSDAQAIFDATVGKLAEEAGLPCTYEEARAHAVALSDLDDAELNAVAGGGCWIVGGSDGADADDCAACVYVGVTVVGFD